MMICHDNKDIASVVVISNAINHKSLEKYLSKLPNKSKSKKSIAEIFKYNYARGTVEQDKRATEKEENFIPHFGAYKSALSSAKEAVDAAQVKLKDLKDKGLDLNAAQVALIKAETTVKNLVHKLEEVKEVQLKKKEYFKDSKEIESMVAKLGQTEPFESEDMDSVLKGTFVEKKETISPVEESREKIRDDNKEKGKEKNNDFNKAPEKENKDETVRVEEARQNKEEKKKRASFKKVA